MGAKEVAAGAAWLDEVSPGWEREIDLGTLALNSCQDCICGQSLRKVAMEAGAWSGYDYAKALNRFNPLQWAEDHGFTILRTSDGEWEPSDGEWEHLESLWRELIKERFSTGNLSDNVE